MRELKININHATTIISILYINNAFFGFIKDITVLNAFCLLCMVLWLFVASKENGFLQTCLKTCSSLIIYTLCIIVIYFLNGSALGPTLWQNLRNAFFSLICSFLCLYVLPQERKCKRKIMLFLLGNILLGCVYTLYRIRENPLLPRILAKGSEAVEMYLGGNANTAGILTYGGIYGLAIIFPSFLYWISKKQGQNKIVPIVVMLICIYTVFKSQFAIALFFAIVGAILYLILCGGHSKARFIVSVLFVLLAFVLAVNWENILNIIYNANILPSALQQKAYELMLYSSGKRLLGTNLYSRVSYYTQSIEAIVKNKFIGRVFLNNAAGAGHTEWEDMAANYGLIAPVLILIFFRKFSKQLTLYLDENNIMVYRIQLLIFMLIGFIDPIFHSRTMSYLLFLSPMILTMYQPDSQSTMIDAEQQNNPDENDLESGTDYSCE